MIYHSAPSLFFPSLTSHFSTPFTRLCIAYTDVNKHVHVSVHLKRHSHKCACFSPRFIHFHEPTLAHMCSWQSFRCNAPQHNATHCNTPHETATHYSTHKHSEKRMCARNNIFWLPKSCQTVTRTQSAETVLFWLHSELMRRGNSTLSRMETRDDRGK